MIDNVRDVSGGRGASDHTKVICKLVFYLIRFSGRNELRKDKGKFLEMSVRLPRKDI